MARILQVLDAIGRMTAKGEDGRALAFERRAPASLDEIESEELSTGMAFPAELRELLLYTDGCALFGLSIQSIDEHIHHPDHGLITFHNWGNGDFDCIATDNSRFPEGAVLFSNHSPDVVVQVAASLSDWFERVVEEIKREGALRHPGDYRGDRRRAAGVYGDVMASLAGIDCELNG